MATSQWTSQDSANLALGALVLVGTFLTGRIMVQAVIDHRREQFDAKGKTKPEIEAKESTADGVVKVLGAAYALYTLDRDLPIVIAEAKKLLQ